MESTSQATLPDDQKPCIACFQPIDCRANICHQCGSTQVAKKWKNVGNVLKWAGGITAIISLVITLGQVNNFLDDWKNSQRNIDIFLESANVQRDAGDYTTAWQSYEKVLEIDPGNTEVFDEQLKLATAWLQNVPSVRSNFSLSKGTRIAGYLDSILSVLYRGIVTAQADNELSTIYAHIGLLHLYKYQSRKKETGSAALKEVAQETLKKALVLDKINLHANSFMGYFLYYFSRYGENQWNKGLVNLERMNQQYNDNKRSDIIYQLVLVDWAPAAYALPKILQLFRENKPVQEYFYRQIFESYFRLSEDMDLDSRAVTNLKTLSKADALELLGYLDHLDVKAKVSVALLVAVLDEVHGDFDEARTKFTELSLLEEGYDTPSFFKSAVRAARIRLNKPETQ